MTLNGHGYFAFWPPLLYCFSHPIFFVLFAQGTDKEWLLAKDLAEGHTDELTLHQKERDSKTMQVWDCTIKKSLKDLIGTTYTNKMHLLFDSSILGAPKLSVLDLEQYWDGWPLEKFSQEVYEWVRTKHAGKTHVGLWGQSSIRDVTNGIRADLS